MAKLQWDESGKHIYETGISKGVLYVRGSQGYETGVAWNGLTTVTENPTGADANAIYADNIKYLNLIAAEDFEGTIEAYTYPDEFKPCNGELELTSGMTVGQQNRKTFAFSYRTEVGNDTEGVDYGYKLHIVYGATASPSERSFETINDNPDAIQFSWDFKTVPVTVSAISNVKATALVVLDSTVIGSSKMTAIEDVLYGNASSSATLLMPDAIYSILTAP